MLTNYNLLKTPPTGVIKSIDAGRLKGKSDINPQWKIEAMTSVYGPCGIGWKHELAKLDTVPLDDGQIMVFMMVNVYIKDGENWSSAIPGMGGDFIVKKESKGLFHNDEAYKMCYTDALGNALKCLGVAADVYRGIYETKYSAPNGRKNLGSKEIAEIEVLARRKGADLSKALSFFGVDGVADLSDDQLAKLKKQLESRADV